MWNQYIFNITENGVTLTKGMHNHLWCHMNKAPCWTILISFLTAFVRYKHIWNTFEDFYKILLWQNWKKLHWLNIPDIYIFPITRTYKYITLGVLKGLLTNQLFPSIPEMTECARLIQNCFKSNLVIDSHFSDFWFRKKN